MTTETATPRVKQIAILVKQMQDFINAKPSPRGKDFTATIDSIGYNAAGVPCSFEGKLTIPAQPANGTNAAIAAQTIPMSWNINGDPMGMNDTRASLITLQPVKDFLKQQ